jgi:hypothetical protein
VSSKVPAASEAASTTSSRVGPPIVRAPERGGSMAAAAEEGRAESTDDPMRPTPDPWYDAGAGSTSSDDPVPALPAASATGPGGQPGRP